jgi:hypothetical protein
MRQNKKKYKTSSTKMLHGMLVKLIPVERLISLTLTLRKRILTDSKCKLTVLYAKKLLNIETDVTTAIFNEFNFEFFKFDP